MGSPLDPSELGLCWSCQTTLDDESAVWIDDDHAIQCCRGCWTKVPIAQRLEIAMKFHDRSINGLGVRETMDAIRDLIANSIDGYFHKFLDDDARRN